MSEPINRGENWAAQVITIADDLEVAHAQTCEGGTPHSVWDCLAESEPCADCGKPVVYSDYYHYRHRVGEACWLNPDASNNADTPWEGVEWKGDAHDDPRNPEPVSVTALDVQRFSEAIGLSPIPPPKVTRGTPVDTIEDAANRLGILARSHRAGGIERAHDCATMGTNEDDDCGYIVSATELNAVALAARVLQAIVEVTK